MDRDRLATGGGASGAAARAVARTWRRVVPDRARHAVRLRLTDLTIRTRLREGPARGRPPESVPPPRAERPRFPRVADSVSVVVPTLNAGPELARHLATIRAQEGLGDLELIVADSGSSDGTPAIAEAAGARVLRVDPDGLEHEEVRDRTAEGARGDVLLLTVQDAVLLTRTAIRDLVLELRAEPGMAAVSARRVPRTDADLYGCFLVLCRGHQASDGRAADGRPDRLPGRATGALDGVCTVIRRSAWEELRLSPPSVGEHLDFRLPADERGWSIGRTTAVAVAHSPRGDAPRHLRQSIAERFRAAPIEDDSNASVARPGGPGHVITAGRELVAEVEGILAGAAPAAGDGPLISQMGRLRAGLGSAPGSRPPTGELAALDAELAALDARLAADDGRAEDRRHAVMALRHDLAAVLSWAPFGCFVRANRGAREEEGRELAGKLTAAVVGGAIGESLGGGAGARSEAADRLVARH